MTDQKNRQFKARIILLFVILIGTVSAITTNPSEIVLQELGDSVLIDFSGVTSNTTVNLIGDISEYTYLQYSWIDSTSHFLNIYLDSIPTETKNGYIIYGGEFTPVSILVEEETQSASNFISFPTSKNFEYKQGNIYNEELKLRLSSSYPNPIKVTYVDFSPSTSVIRQGNGLETGIFVNPGESFTIPLIIDTTEAQAGSYSPVEVLVEYDDDTGLHTMTSTVTLYVTTQVTPITGDTFSTPPTCSLSATTFNLNNTYSFTCSGIVSNLEVEPQYSEFIQGKTVETSNGIYRYDFIPTQYGETDFITVFRYKGAPIFKPFSQQIRITSSGSLVAGTSLKFIFTPRLDTPTNNEKYIIQLVDNKTGSLVSSPRIFIDAIEVISDTDVFEFYFLQNTDYELRGRAVGYEDLVEMLNINPQIISIKITPSTGDTSTKFNITTSIENATLNVGGIDYIGNYFGTLRGGINEITISKDGYQTQAVNFSVDDRPRVVSLSTEFKKGVEQNITLNQNESWVVLYKKNLDSLDVEELVIGNGNSIIFTPKKTGVYTIKSNEFVVGIYEVSGFSLKNKWIGMPAWLVLLFGIVVLIIIFIIIISRSSSQGQAIGNDTGGGLFAVGDGAS